MGAPNTDTKPAAPARTLSLDGAQAIKKALLASAPPSMAGSEGRMSLSNLADDLIAAFARIDAATEPSPSSTGQAA